MADIGKCNTPPWELADLMLGKRHPEQVEARRGWRCWLHRLHRLSFLLRHRASFANRIARFVAGSPTTKEQRVSPAETPAPISAESKA